MLRGLWQRVKDTVYDTVSGLFRTQEEIDDVIESDLSNYGVVTYDPLEIPVGTKLRKRTFWTPEDLKKYITDGGIPPDYCHILVLPDWDDEGNSAYRLYVEEG